MLDTVSGDVWCDDVGDYLRDMIWFCIMFDRLIESCRLFVELFMGVGFIVEGA